ncbi:hypothetical protein BM221_005869 [Beauveria bassiana]|uniref:Uncharacterized protein n=1 Tax=Beauveria bassiana TaxID=176275 RepID=A0A2N6NK93_BEABA|nr:hypothetical protein BM221_005869 [Beauveria bassiana]
MAHVPIMLRISAFEKAAERSSCASPSYARVFSVLNRFTEIARGLPARPRSDPRSATPAAGAHVINLPHNVLSILLHVHSTSPSPHLLLPHAPLLPFLAAILAISRLASASPLFVFDSTAYTNTTIGFGTSHINWIPAYVCNPLVADGALPTQQAWQRIVTPWAVHPGYPLVLDCENIYLKSAETADANLATMQTLQTWAAAVLPREGQIIGWYGLAGNTPPARFGHYRALIAQPQQPRALPVGVYVFRQFRRVAREAGDGDCAEQSD